MKRHPSSRLVPLAAAVALVLAACGSDEPGQSAGSTIPSTPSTDDSTADDGLLKPRPIEIGAGSGSARTAELAAESDAAGSVAMDMIAPFRVVDFVVGDLPPLPTNDVGYVFQAGATASAEQVAGLAAALGVPGDPQRIEEQGGHAFWRVGPDDGTAPSLWLYEDAQLSWSYSWAWANEQPVAVGCGVAGSAPEIAAREAEAALAEDAPAPDTVPVETCPEPEPPEGVPTAEEAEARTLELLSTLGIDASGWKFDTYADEWFASVNLTEQLGGALGGRSLGAGFGAGGALQYANGQLAEPQPVGPYPLIDLDTAIARLEDQSGFYGGWGGIALDTAVAREGGADTAVAIDVPEADPAQQPEEVTVTLVDVQADVWWAWDVDGSVWLLPAYRFIGDDGGWYTVPAVTDEYLVQVPVDTVPIDPMPVEPVPATEPAPVETTAPVEPQVDLEPLEAAVGTSLAEFTAVAESLGLTVRVVEQDGESLAVTDDFRTDRVNVAVAGEAVTQIVNIG